MDSFLQSFIVRPQIQVIRKKTRLRQQKCLWGLGWQEVEGGKRKGREVELWLVCKTNLKKRNAKKINALIVQSKIILVIDSLSKEAIYLYIFSFFAIWGREGSKILEERSHSKYYRL